MDDLQFAREELTRTLNARCIQLESQAVKEGFASLKSYCDGMQESMAIVGKSFTMIVQSITEAMAPLAKALAPLFVTPELISTNKARISSRHG